MVDETVSPSAVMVEAPVVALASRLATFSATAAPTVAESPLAALPSASAQLSWFEVVDTLTAPSASTVVKSAIMAVTSLSAILMEIAAATLMEPSEEDASGAVVELLPSPPVLSSACPLAKSICPWLWSLTPSGLLPSSSPAPDAAASAELRERNSPEAARASAPPVNVALRINFAAVVCSSIVSARLAPMVVEPPSASPFAVVVESASWEALIPKSPERVKRLPVPTNALVSPRITEMATTGVATVAELPLASAPPTAFVVVS